MYIFICINHRKIEKYVEIIIYDEFFFEMVIKKLKYFKTIFMFHSNIIL